MKVMKIILIAGASLLAVIILPFIILVSVSIHSDVQERKFLPVFPDAQMPATAKVPLSVTQVRARLAEKFGIDGKDLQPVSRPEYGPQFARFIVLTNENSNIDDMFRFTDHGLSSEAPISTMGLDLEVQDPGLPKYLQLAIPERQHDLYIESYSVWTTIDIQKNGQPMPYSSSYILHFKALSPKETQITVLSYNPNIVDGKRWSVIGDVFFTAPRRVDNVLRVPPSPADKRAMLKNVLKLLE
jgi:hypothetical protein